MTDAHVGLAGQLTRLPQRQVLSDDVYETVKGLIMDSVVEPGTRLNIDALTRELGISQTPIRESLARLKDEMLSYTDVPDRPDYDSYKAMAAHDQRFHDLVLELLPGQPAGHPVTTQWLLDHQTVGLEPGQ